MLTKCCLFPVGFSVHLFLVCFDSLVTICTKLELILKVCFDSTFTQGEFDHVARVIHHGGGWHESNWSDQAEFTDGEAMPAKQNSLEGQVKHWRCALHTAGWLAARPFGECMNLMQVGFKIIKCMIYWKKASSRTISSRTETRKFLQTRSTVVNSLHGPRYTCTAAWLLPNSQSVSSSHGSQKSMCLLFVVWDRCQRYNSIQILAYFYEYKI